MNSSETVENLIRVNSWNSWLVLLATNFTARLSRNQTKVLRVRVLRAFAVKVQPRIHREAAKSAKSAKKNPFLPAMDFRLSITNFTKTITVIWVPLV
ncbi:MAG: hypothetical protein DMG08_02495 [Acidobacteria bacterium]|nr:MAG: hypothetical protein DMG08_02495 [Acidobacteriota bacterium]